ncbi:MAG: hypothetical protein RJA70_4497 [Pseudomonadota bacterium]|jgi:hypothetical protein
MIDNPDQAKRLAAAIANDLQLYNQEKIAAGEALGAELAEARALFEGRVSSQLWPIFDSTIGPALGIVTEPSVPVRTPGYALPPGLFEDVHLDSAPRVSGRGIVGPVLLVAISMLAGVV